MTAETDDGRDELAALRREFAGVMVERLDHIAGLWRRVSERWEDQPVAELAFYVHRMSGSAGSFGYLEVSRAALELETWLKRWIDSGRAPEAGELATGEALVERMRRGANS